jgi:hypothetical protein
MLMCWTELRVVLVTGRIINYARPLYADYNWLKLNVASFFDI